MNNLKQLSEMLLNEELSEFDATQEHRRLQRLATARQIKAQSGIDRLRLSAPHAAVVADTLRQLRELAQTLPKGTTLQVPGGTVSRAGIFLTGPDGRLVTVGEFARSVAD